MDNRRGLIKLKHKWRILMRIRLLAYDILKRQMNRLLNPSALSLRRRTAGGVEWPEAPERNSSANCNQCPHRWYDLIWIIMWRVWYETPTCAAFSEGGIVILWLQVTKQQQRISENVNMCIVNYLTFEYRDHPKIEQYFHRPIPISGMMTIMMHRLTQ